MMTTLVICAIGFISAQPIPDGLRNLYLQSYHCPSTPTVTLRPARVPLVYINSYFPAAAKEWPVLRGGDPDLVEKAQSWILKGVQPGILLPVNAEQALRNKSLFNRIKTAVRNGALPIAWLRAPLPRVLWAARYVWCMSGVCPAAWYLPEGLSHDQTLLPMGVYLVAPHWVGRNNLPLPYRVLRFGTQTLLPFQKLLPAAGGVAAVLHVRESIHAFTPTVSMRWKWLGVSFERDNSGLHTGVSGKVLLAVGGGSIRVWSMLKAWQGNIPMVLSENFSWLALVFGVLNLGVLSLIITRRRRGARIGHIK